ncbi:MAG: hypothetical protein SF339_06420, partial [Blastocatellia bacterium]|nr:hypothetical protein [Blastocatellia bacterium]
MGGGIEFFVTKSGGRDIHGNVFDFHTSSAPNAAPWVPKVTPLGAGVVARKSPSHGNTYRLRWNRPKTGRAGTRVSRVPALPVFGRFQRD